MNDVLIGWEEKEFKECILENRKSTLKVSDASNFGDFNFYTSGESILKHDRSLIDGENIYLATGGIANVKFENGLAAYSTDTYSLKSKEDVNTKYLYYYLLNNLQYINDNFFQGSGLKHLQKKDLKNYLVYIPKNINEQKKIVEILTKVDEAIENTEVLIQKYERIKVGLIQDLLTKGIDKNGTIRSEKTHQFKDSMLGRIPVEWEVKNIGSISTLVRSGVTPRGGSDVYGHSGIMFLRSQNVYPNKFKLDDVAYISESINNRMLGSQLNEYDVLLNITGASIGRSTYIPSNFPICNVNQHVCLIRLKDPDKIKSYYLSTFLNSYLGQNQIIQFNSGGNREGLNYKQIKEFIFPWFNDKYEFAAFHKFLSKIDAKIDNELLLLKKLLLQKQGLMQDLLSGNVRVNY
jgi:type I restriction enzyme, S subunit